MKKLFISRDLELDSPLHRLDNEFEVIAQSLIRFEGISLKTPINTSWLFFYSKNGVKYLSEATPGFDVSKYKIGCLGTGTGKVFETIYNYKPAFVGNGIPEVVSQKFRQQLKPSDTITFISASQSKHSIQQLIGHDYFTQSIPVYKNESKKAFQFPQPDIGIFTSPLNVASFMKVYPLVKLKLVIAIGKTTAKYLHQSGVQHVIIACEPSDQGLFNALKIASISDP